MRKNRSQLTALVISVIVHLLILVLYKPLSLISFSPDDVDSALVAVRPLVFELVETPEDAIRQRPEVASLLSDKDAIARNEKRPEDLREGEAYSEGISEHRIFAGDMSTSSGADVSEDSPDPRQSDSDEADERQDSDKASMSDMVIRVPQDLGEIFSRNRSPALNSSHDRQSSQSSSFTDDVDYDQRREAAKALGGVTLNTYDWDFASYILEMKRKLRSNTHPPGAFSPLGLIDGQTVLTFRVMSDGRVEDLNVVEYKGDRTLMETSVDAVEASSAFSPLPDDFPEEYLELTWTFIFYVYRR
ncbi:MAG: hypothetical protein KOO63_13315 [Bacteroidales bacterium]|nr:hypothetical protein [Candidatus Latescibacterota bacterium]